MTTASGSGAKASDEPLVRTDVPPRRPARSPSSAPGSGAASPESRRTATAGTKYTVREGDTYWGIAKRVYGAGSLWPTISKANPENQSLKPGVELVIPPRPDREAAVSPAATTTESERRAGSRSDSGRTYQAQKGDTPRGIARKFYGDAEKYTLLYDANPELRYRNLLAGEEIRVPGQ